MKKKLLRSLLALAFLICTSTGSQAQEAFIGEIKLVAFNFAPRGWANCEGQLLPIAQHNALFSLLGTMYGGDGRTTFALPDLRGRVPVGVGNAPGINGVRQGEQLAGANLPDVKTNKHTIHTGTTTTTPGLGLRYVICLVGIFPARS